MVPLGGWRQLNARDAPGERESDGKDARRRRGRAIVGTVERSRPWLEHIEVQRSQPPTVSGVHGPAITKIRSHVSVNHDIRSKPANGKARSDVFQGKLRELLS